MKEVVMNEAFTDRDSVETAPRAFTYDRPQLERERHVVMLAQTDRMMAAVQVLKSGGENNLHSHTNLDGFWMVLKGRVRFYGDGDALLGEFGPYSGILIPRGSRYWFESCSDEPLELLQVEAFNVPLRNMKSVFADRVNFTPVTSATRNAKVHDGREPSTDPAQKPA